MCHSDQAEQQILKFSDTHWAASSLSNWAMKFLKGCCPSMLTSAIDFIVLNFSERWE